jgi:acyl dehydratase
VSEVKRRHFVQFAGASGDFNPIHYDEPYATSVGDPSVFGQGMFSASVLSNAVADWFGLVNVTELQIRFHSKLWPGETIQTVGEITEITPMANGIKLAATIGLVTSDGNTIVGGHAKAELPD